MPTVARSRNLPVEPATAWRLLADPHNLPRWWTDTVRVESVDGDPGARRSRFTQVFQTERGKTVRADWKISESTRDERIVWEQQLEGTPFAKFLRGNEMELKLRPAEAGETEVTIEARRLLRGMSRLGAPMMSRATKRILDDALDGIEQVLVDPITPTPPRDSSADDGQDQRGAEGAG